MASGTRQRRRLGDQAREAVVEELGALLVQIERGHWRHEIEGIRSSACWLGLDPKE